MISHDYECITIATNLAESHRKFGFTIKLTLLNAFLNGHRFCTSNGTVPFEVATNRMDYNALPAGCCIISCCPLLLELTSSEPLTLDEEMHMQEEWHPDERIEDLKEYRRTHGHLNVTRNEDSSLNHCIMVWFVFQQCDPSFQPTVKIWDNKGHGNGLPMVPYANPLHMN